MDIVEFPFPIEIGLVYDLDFTSDGIPVSIQGSSNHQVLMWGDQSLNLPNAWSSPDFPFVRCLPDGRVLVVDTGWEAARRKNAWILNIRGKTSAGLQACGRVDRPTSLRAEVDANFDLGSAAVEIVCLWGLIAVAYHPISAQAIGHQIQPVQRTAVAFFDPRGRLVMGFNQESASCEVLAENVRCMTALSRSQILFSPESLFVEGQSVENPLVLFDCASPKRPILFSAPYPRPEALASDGGLIHMASPEGWEDQIITFDPTRKISQHRGDFLGIFRGLTGGAFLAQLSTSEYAMIVPGAIEGPNLFLSDDDRRPMGSNNNPSGETTSPL